MAYEKNEDLPRNVKDHLLPHAQDIYREAYNNALREYEKPTKRREPEDDLESVAHKVAWSAVKRKYRKGCGEMWVPKQ